MDDRNNWNWEPEVREIADAAPLPGCDRQEEWQASPDGESMAAVVVQDDGTFAVRRNDALWEVRAEKIYRCLFAPDNRLTALARLDGEWALMVDDAEVGEHADYYWGTMFSPGGAIAVPMQTGMEYGVMLDGKPWENLYTSATDFAVSANGRSTAAVVQTASLGQADLEGFRKGVFTLAVNGNAWDSTFLNAWAPSFDREGHRVACTVRLTPFEYTVAINGQCWDETFPCAWEPVFDPRSGDVLAPIRKNGAWGVARNGALFWKTVFQQCWGIRVSPVEGGPVWAVVAPAYGSFTVAGDAKPWACRFPSVTDLVLSPDGRRAAALGSDNNRDFRVVVDGKPWEQTFDMAWPAVFSADGSHAAAKVRKGGRYAVYADNKPVAENLDDVWTPSFSPAGDVLLFCSLQDGKFRRHTVKLPSAKL